jgi:proline iminopeptidase
MDLRVNGTTLHCESIGEGRPCLALHGGPGTDSSGLARSLAPIAAELGLRLILYDHRGHGRSEWVPVEQCTQDQLAADVDGVRQALGLGPVDVLGISWGGFLGLMYAAQNPSAIRSLAVVGAAASRDFMARAEDNARRRAPPSSGRPIARCGTARYRTTRASGGLRDHPPSLLLRSRSRRENNAARADIRYRLAVRRFVIEHEYARYDCRAELSRIACPTLVAVGRHDWICPVDQSEEIARLVPGAELPCSRSAATRRTSSSAPRSRGAWRRSGRSARSGYLPVQRTLFSD